ncbi:MAG: O-antigen ligase family protein [Candidatus Omnitrophota bacterium]
MKEKIYKYCDWLCEYSVYALIFFIPISIAAIESFTGFLFLGFIIKKIIKPDFKFLKSYKYIFPLLFIFFSALSLLNSGAHIQQSLIALILKWMKRIAICLVVIDTIPNFTRFKKAYLILIFSSAIIGIDGIIQKFIGLDLFRHKNLSLADGFYGITASFNHYNDFGSYLVVLLSLIFSILIVKKLKFSYRLSAGLLGILLGVCIIFTFSRGSWLAMFISFIFIAILSRGNIKRLIPVFLLVVVLFLLPVSHERVFSTFKAGGDSDRFRYWLAAWKMINEHPFFGMGIGTFMANFSKYEPNSYISYAHNCYFQIWAETGIFSLLSFLLFIGAVLFGGIKKVRLTNNPLLMGLVCGFFGLLVHIFFDTQLYSVQLATFFWLILALTITATKIDLSPLSKS